MFRSLRILFVAGLLMISSGLAVAQEKVKEKVEGTVERVAPKSQPKVDKKVVKKVVKTLPSREISCLSDVQSAFNRIPARASKSEYLAAWDNGEIRWPRYTNDQDNMYPGGPGSTLPIGGGQNHFQGIARYGQYAFVSGSNPHDGSISYAGQTVRGPDTKGAAFYVIKMNSKPANGAWSSPRGNLEDRTIASKDLDDVPPRDDMIVAKVRVDRDLWHAGGMQIMENILAIPVEDDSSSEVVFYDISDPENPRRLAVKITRERKAGAVALTRLANGHILAAVWADSDDGMDQNLDFYYSLSSDLADGFHPYVRWDKDLVKASERRDQDETFGKFQTVNFIRQCDGMLYLMGMHNTSSMAPSIAGRDYADLYQVAFTSDEELAAAVRSGGPDAVLNLLRNPSTYRQVPRITKVANKHMYCHDRQCNFDAGGTAYLVDRNTMYIYAVYHWRENRDRHENLRVIPFNEYAP